MSAQGKRREGLETGACAIHLSAGNVSFPPLLRRWGTGMIDPLLPLLSGTMNVKFEFIPALAFRGKMVRMET
jgi:hypothetical protein